MGRFIDAPFVAVNSRYVELIAKSGQENTDASDDDAKFNLIGVKAYFRPGDDSRAAFRYIFKGNSRKMVDENIASISRDDNIDIIRSSPTGTIASFH